MPRTGIILVLVSFFAGCQGWQSPPSACAPVTVAPMGGMVGIPGQPVMVQPQVMSPQMGQPMGPLMVSPEFVPPPQMVGGPPGMAPYTDPFEVPLAEWAPGTALSPAFGLPAGPEISGGLPNPLPVPVTNDELAWDQLADVVDDYFPISSEQRVSRTADVWTEGRIETAPQVGATWLEPHRNDSAGDFNLWESTLQSIRRQAAIRVIPNGEGYLVEVIVQKELEDLPRPELSTASAAAFRSDTSLPSRRPQSVSRRRLSKRWIPLGRDLATEQQLLADIQKRLGSLAATPYPPQPYP